MIAAQIGNVITDAEARVHPSGADVDLAGHAVDGRGQCIVASRKELVVGAGDDD